METRTYNFNDGTEITFKRIPELENDGPIYDLKTTGWFIPTQNCKDGDYFILDGKKYIFKERSKDGQTDIFTEE